MTLQAFLTHRYITALKIAVGQSSVCLLVGKLLTSHFPKCPKTEELKVETDSEGF